MKPFPRTKIHPQDMRAISVLALSTREALDTSAHPPRGSQIFLTTPNVR